MYNLYEYNLHSNFRKLECDELLFVEFQCLPGDVRDGVWSQHSYIAFVLSGKKTWITLEGEFPVYKGDALYCKKGAHLVENFYEEEFCALLFFFPEEFIKEIVLEFHEHSQISSHPAISNEHILQINVDVSLKSFFDSVMSYFFLDNNPSKHLVKLKFKELILQILTNDHNPELAAYFLSMVKGNRVTLKQIMQENFLYRLSLNDFAKLSNRSLSAFKRDFYEIYGASPGKWLSEQRIKYAKMRLLTTDENINDVAFHSGFETTSHFIRCFKKHFGLPPHQFRKKHMLQKK